MERDTVPGVTTPTDIGTKIFKPSHGAEYFVRSPTRSSAPRSVIFGLLAIPLVAATPACWLFSGGGARPSESPQAVDSIAGYEGAGDEHAARLAVLRYVEVRKALRPRFAENAAFAAKPGGPANARLSPGVEMVFSGEENGWYALEATRISPPMNGEKFSVFATADGPLVMSATKQFGDKKTLGFDDIAGVPLVRTDSFDAEFRVLRSPGGLKFCFFSESPTECKGGYEFKYTRSKFAYRLRRQADGKTFCQFVGGPDNLAQTQSLMQDGNRNELDPHIEVSAHNGYITVEFNGEAICSAEGETFQPGYFLVGQAPAVVEFSIDLNGGSAPFYADAGSVVDLDVLGEELRPRAGQRAGAYNDFVADFNAFRAVRGGKGEPPQFKASFFNLLLGGAESETAYKQAVEAGTLDGYIAFLQKYPVNAHKQEIQEKASEVVLASKNEKDAKKFLSAFSGSDAELQIIERQARGQWNAIVGSSPNARNLAKYLKKHPDAMFAARAQLLLESLEFRKANRSESETGDRVKAEAQRIVAKSPVTLAWDVEIIDFVDGSIFYNLNGSPNGQQGTGVGQLNYLLAEKTAFDDTCTLLKQRLPEISTCDGLTLDANAGKRQAGRMDSPVLVQAAIKSAIEKYYLPRIKRGVEFDRAVLVGLLDRMKATNDEHRRDWAWMANMYADVGLVDEAALTFYEYARAIKSPGHVSSSHRVVIKNDRLLANAWYKRALASYGEP